MGLPIMALVLLLAVISSIQSYFEAEVEAPIRVDNGVPVVFESMPHIVLMLVDDMGYNDIGYQSNDLFRATPTIDALAAAGIKLTNYYVTPARLAVPYVLLVSSHHFPTLHRFWLVSLLNHHSYDPPTLTLLPTSHSFARSLVRSFARSLVHRPSPCARHRGLLS